jgi:hypothetical protein
MLDHALEAVAMVEGKTRADLESCPGSQISKRPSFLDETAFSF